MLNKDVANGLQLERLLVGTLSENGHQSQTLALTADISALGSRPPSAAKNKLPTRNYLNVGSRR
jgi:hypothetical protein